MSWLTTATIVVGTYVALFVLVWYLPLEQSELVRINQPKE